MRRFVEKVIGFFDKHMGCVGQLHCAAIFRQHDIIGLSMNQQPRGPDFWHALDQICMRISKIFDKC